MGRGLADGLADGVTTQVAIIKYARGATNLYENWKAGGDNTTTGDGAAYQSFQISVDEGLAALAAKYPNAIIEIEGMLWVQGEWDALELSNAQNYETNLTNFIADIRLTYGTDLPFVISRLSSGQTYINATSLATVQAAQDAVAAADPLASVFNTDTFGLFNDNLHFNEEGQQDIGDAASVQLLDFLNVPTPPQISSLTPAHLSSGHLPTDNLSITFDENVAFGTGNITIRQAGGAQIETYAVTSPGANLSISGDTLTINPTADLSTFTTYYVEIPATAIQDLAGNPFGGISGSGTWFFTTSDPASTILFDFQNDLTTDIAADAVAVTDLSSPVNGNGVTLTATVGNDTASSRDRGANTGPNSEITRDFIQWGIANPITITISGLVADQEYGFRLWSGDLAGGQIKTTDHTIAGASGGGTIRHTSVSLADENATGGSLVEFPNVVSTSTGTLTYTIDYVGGGGTAATLNGFELTAIGSDPPNPDPFTDWTDLGTLPGTVTFDGDLNADGVQDGLALLLGISNPDNDATGALPNINVNGSGGLVLTFDCLPIADRGGVALKVAYSSTLSGWSTTTDVVPDADGTDAGGFVSYTVDTVSVAPLHRVTATIDASAGSGNKMFGHLEGTK